MDVDAMVLDSTNGWGESLHFQVSESECTQLLVLARQRIGKGRCSLEIILVEVDGDDSEFG